jgi:phasin family protein
MGSLLDAALRHGLVRRQANQKKATTMSKTKTTAENAASTATAEMFAGADVLKSGFEKTAKMFETATDFGKGNIEALVESATITGSGLQTIGSEISLYSKKVIEESVAATKTIMGAKSIHEAIELQTGFAKMCFSAYVGQLKIVNELFAGTVKEALAPVQARYAALSQIAQNATAA